MIAPKIQTNAVYQLRRVARCGKKNSPASCRARGLFVFQ